MTPEEIFVSGCGFIIALLVFFWTRKILLGEKNV